MQVIVHVVVLYADDYTCGIVNYVYIHCYSYELIDNIKHVT